MFTLWSFLLQYPICFQSPKNFFFRYSIFQVKISIWLFFSVSILLLKSRPYTFTHYIHLFLSNLFFFVKEFLSLWLCWVFVSVRGLSLVVASGGHSSSRCTGLSLSWPLLLWSTGSRRTGSVVVAHGPSCSAACGIFPDQGSNPCPLHWQADSQPLCHQGSPSCQIFNVFIIIIFESSLILVSGFSVGLLLLTAFFSWLWDAVSCFFACLINSDCTLNIMGDTLWQIHSFCQLPLKSDELCSRSQLNYWQITLVLWQLSSRLVRVCLFQFCPQSGMWASLLKHGLSGVLVESPRGLPNTSS